MSHLTLEAKSQLSSTIRGLRERLIRDVRDAAEQDYRLSVRAQDAGLSEAARTRRGRLEAWLDERVRSSKATTEKARAEARERFLVQAVKETAATLLNRLVLLRHMEALGLVRPPVITGGWNSKAYRELREFAPALLGDDTEGYAYLLGLVFDELALDLPGLFGDVGVTRLLRVPASTLREVVEQLDDPGLASAWTDDTTLGWVYQYWNDPEREALDAKISGGGKVEPHEIAQKTQMFTERYMVEWLLHNSLGLTWLAMCRKHGWTPDADLVLGDLDRRRVVWREQRERGEVALDALMPIAEGLEDRWKYYVPQPIPEDAVTSAPESIRELKLLDPACGSGHFLIIAFDLLVELYREEARHRGETWSDQEIAESILERNLHGVDIDPRAIQIAAAGLYLKARQVAPGVKIRQLNLVAPTLNLGDLPEDDPALGRLLREVKEETGIPEGLTRKVVSCLAGVDHLGTLLKVDAAVDEALLAFEATEGRGAQLALGEKAEKRTGTVADTRATLLSKLEEFLGRHEGEEDLGLRLDGEQLAAGLRFVRIVKEGTYDVVVGNPPYQGTGKMADARYVAKHYPRGKADLYAAFLERGLELARTGGMSALLTMRGWMFINQFRAIREWLLGEFDLRALGDIDRGGFEDIVDEVVSTVMSVFRKAAPSSLPSVAMQPTPLDDRSRDGQRTNRKRAAVLAQIGRHEFDPRGFEVIEGEPIVYWWGFKRLEEYSKAVKLGEVVSSREGLGTKNDPRYLKNWWEVERRDIFVHRYPYPPIDVPDKRWVPFIKGAEGRGWWEPLCEVVDWDRCGIRIATYEKSRYGRGASLYFHQGVAVVTKGNAFRARLHRFSSIFGHAGTSVFGNSPLELVCLLNSIACRSAVESFNPGISFQLNDIIRIPVARVMDVDTICENADRAFTTHEVARENSVEFKHPGPSPWRYAQDWAQRAVDRPAGEPLPPYEPEYDRPAPEAHVSYAMGVALGRFGAYSEGILDETKPDHHTLIDQALPGGIFFLSDATERDTLDHPACSLLRSMWAEHGSAISPKDDLRAYLRKGYFDYHCKLYENRPIYFPLSSAKRTFVAYVSIHRWKSDTLQTLLAEHLLPERRQLEGELEDLRQARAANQATSKTEKRFDLVKKALAELEELITAVTQIADQGPPPTDPKCPARDQDARFEMDLDDGVMVNSAALWPLLDPQWKKPKGWWKELATAKGKKDYDWSHLAARYWPARVDAKCQEDPSLGVAHHCFWKYHPARAYQWELRLQDEIRPDFTIDEPGSDEHRARFLADHPDQAAEILAKELKRRERKRLKGTEDDDEKTGQLFESEDAEDPGER